MCGQAEIDENMLPSIQALCLVCGGPGQDPWLYEMTNQCQQDYGLGG